MVGKTLPLNGARPMYGLTKERYGQMMAFYGNDRHMVKEVVGDWGPELCNRGWGIFDFDGTGMLEVEAIVCVGAYNDAQAARLAEASGIKIIPVDDLPDNFDRRYFGWVDTEENRRKIAGYCMDTRPTYPAR